MLKSYFLETLKSVLGSSIIHYWGGYETVVSIKVVSVALNYLKSQIKLITSQNNLHVYCKHCFGLYTRGSLVCIFRWSKQYFYYSSIIYFINSITIILWWFETFFVISIMVIIIICFKFFRMNHYCNFYETCRLLCQL